MNREFKFRAWTGYSMDYNVMVGYVGSVYVNPQNGGIDPNDAGSLSPYNTIYSDTIPIMQFTGMEDINGVDIYEGDIVEWGMSHDTINAFPRLRYVEFCKRQFIYKVVEVGDLPSSLDYLYEAAPKSTRWCKVVGNIFQNPELLIN